MVNRKASKEINAMRWDEIRWFDVHDDNDDNDNDDDDDCDYDDDND